MNNFRLLIHHHAVAYQNDEQAIYTPSYIGRWINALSNHIGHISLLLYESETLRPEQDEIIKAENVTLSSLGAPGKTWDRISRIKRLRRVCAQAARDADGLLVRGVTPRQMNIWSATPLRNKAFLLVGSLLETKPILKPTFWGIYDALMWRWRKVEVMKISKKGVVMANSPHIVEELAQLNRPATFVPTNSIRLDEFSPFYIRELSGRRKILFCGRVVPEKGIRELILAVAKLNISQPFTLDIVGSVEPAFRLILNQLIQELGIFESVKWHGHIPYGASLFTFYRLADVFVLPTYYEGFPHVIWEAAANCCPVVTTHVGGIPALWENNRHGILVAPKDSSAITEALNRLFNDNDLRHRLIQNAYIYAKNFTVNSCAARLVNTLSENGWGK